MSQLRSKVLRLASTLPKGDPTRRQLLEAVRQAGLGREALFGTSAAVRGLPDGVQRVLKRVGYARRDINVQEATSVRSSAGGEGRRAFLVILEARTGRVIHESSGSWGGMSPWETTDHDKGGTHALSPGVVAIQGTEGGSVWAMLYHHPADAELFLKDAPKGDITPDEKKAVEVLSLVSGYRQNEWIRQELPGRYSATHPIVQSLIAKGLAVVNARGALSLTTAGKNVK